MLSSLLALRLWQGRSIEVVPILLQFESTPYPFAASVAVYLWRAGEQDQAREYYAEHGARLDHENEISLLAWCHAAELALYLGERDLAAGAYERLVPYAGRSCCAGLRPGRSGRSTPTWRWRPRRSASRSSRPGTPTPPSPPARPGKSHSSAPGSEATRATYGY